jgi:hypothetical protein
MTLPMTSPGQPDRLSRRRNRWIAAKTAVAARTLAIVVTGTLGASGLASAQRPTIAVSTAAELQAAVADPANAGRTIVLAPNTYYLDPSGPTLGRLELQTDMELRGVPGRSDAVIIDASLLPQPSYSDGALFTGALRMGRGRNAARWLTLRSAAAGAAFVETDLPPSVSDDQTSVTVDHCIIEDNIRAIDFRLVGPAASRRALSGYFTDNVLKNNTASMGQGIRIVYLQGVEGATLRAAIRGNSITGNLAGLFAASNGSSGNSIEISSTNNRYSGNGVGGVLVAGLSAGKQADDNGLTFDSQNDEFAGNSLATTQYAAAGAGLAVTGGDSTGTVAGRTNRNSALVNLRYAQFDANPAGDLVLFGAHGTNSLVAGVSNQVVVALFGGTPDRIVHQMDSDPPEPTNHVTVINFPAR